MSDLKKSCPACDSWTSAVGQAFLDGEPCPYCGFPAEAARQLEAAESRGADQKMIDAFVEAEKRATKAETELAQLRRALADIRSVVRRWGDETNAN